MMQRNKWWRSGGALGLLALLALGLARPARTAPPVTESWVARYNGPANAYEEALKVAVDGDGNVYVTGYSDNGVNLDYATVKYNASGVQQWVQRYNGLGNSDDYAYALAVDEAGNVYVTGYSIGSGTLDDYATVKYSPPNNAPQVQQDRPLTVQEDAAPTPLDITSPIDPDGDPLSILVNAVPNASTGTVRTANNTVVAVNNALTLAELTQLNFHVVPDASGDAGTFQYTVTDGRGGSASQTLTLEITAVNDAPAAQGDSYSGWRGCRLEVPRPGVLANDTDADGDSLTTSLVTGPTGGNLGLNADGSFFYVPGPGTTSDSFTYRVYDGIDYSTSVTVTLTLAADSTAPGAQIGSVVTESPTRVYVPITISDGQSGVARISLTPSSTNSRLEWDGPDGLVTLPAGTALALEPAVASTTVRVVKLNVLLPAQVEVQVTDCAGNSTQWYAGFENLQVVKRKLTRVYRKLPEVKHRLRLENGTPGLASVTVKVNGKSAYHAALIAGQVLQLDLARWMRPGHRNTVQVTVTGPAGGMAVLLIGDDTLAEATAAGRAKASGVIRSRLELPR